MNDRGKAVVVLSGGNAPGALEFVVWLTRRFKRHRIPVYGTRHGFKPLMNGSDGNGLVRLNADRLASAGPGSIPLISFGRSGPGTDVEQAASVIRRLLKWNVKYLIGYGGEGTANTMLSLERAARRIEAEGGGRICIGMGPKSIDRDLSLSSDTIGFQTKSALLGEMLRRISYDAWMSDDRWFVVVVQGRTVGHLAWRAAIQSDAAVWLIPEQFTEKVDFSLIVDIIVGAMLKGLIHGQSQGRARPQTARMHGHIVVSEGLPLCIREGTCPEFGRMNFDERGRPKLAEFPLHTVLSDAVNAALGELRVAERLGGNGISLKGQQLGYTARGAEPNSVDRELARELATALVHQLVKEELSGVVPFIDGESIGHVALEHLVGEDRNTINPRQVNIHADRYQTEWDAARELRLVPEDLGNEQTLSALVGLTTLSREAFLARFSRIAEWGDKV
ncbi:MAG: 6-phosphofructokinase [Planctomycetales bacterium]|nr:6-phosphofructokinase [Planctomycetales bacterium]